MAQEKGRHSDSKGKAWVWEAGIPLCQQPLASEMDAPCQG